MKSAEQFLGNLDHKRVLLIGATGKIGTIVMKNMVSDYDLELYVTSRQIEKGSHRVVGTGTLADGHCSGRHYRTEQYEAISYDERYQYMDGADVIISATASPHYTITKERWRENVVTDKPRILVDLAVPMDIESGIADGGKTCACHMDDLTAIAGKNNALRMAEADLARRMLEEDRAQFECWLLFQDHLPLMRAVRERILTDAGKGDLSKAIDKLFYRVRESASPEQLKVFYDLLEQSEKV